MINRYENAPEAKQVGDGFQGRGARRCSPTPVKFYWICTLLTLEFRLRALGQDSGDDVNKQARKPL